MNAPLDDTISTRFASFWIALFAFFFFALIAVIAVPLLSDEVDGDPTLDGGEIGAARAETAETVHEEQAKLVAKIGWADEANGLVTVPAEMAFGAIAKQLEQQGAAKSNSLVPGSATQLKLLEEQAAAAAAAAADDGDAQKIVLKAVPNQMKYDLKEFEVTAGKPVIITIQNPDALQHNLLICKPGSKDKVGMAANLMAADPKALEKQYVPESDDVLFASKLIDPSAVGELKFTAPSEPGDYPYLCTFPGHWVLMNGVMKVVAE